MAQWMPYQNNGGTSIALAGKGYAIIAADRRLSVGYTISSRESTKISQLTNKAVLASCGMQADRHTLHSILKSRMKMYQLEHGKEMTTHAISQMLSRTLYYRRFFVYCLVTISIHIIHCNTLSIHSLIPYHPCTRELTADTFNILAGIDEKGEGFVYSYDAVGSFEAQKHAVNGDGGVLAVPLLDNFVEKKHRQLADKKEMTKDEALQMIKNTMNAVVEREITTGDSADIYIITPDGVEHEKFDLRKD